MDKRRVLLIPAFLITDKWNYQQRKVYQGRIAARVGFSKQNWFVVSASWLQVFILLLSVALRKTSLTYKPRGSEGLGARPSLCLRVRLSLLEMVL